MTSLDRVGKALAKAVDRIDSVTDRFWLYKMRAYLYVAEKLFDVNMKLYDKIMAMAREIEGAEYDKGMHHMRKTL